jgi:S-methylmethionine-dependent homocysteine/selenocysteine methylase
MSALPATDATPRAGVVLLDGGVGAELHRRGIAMRAPWWTSLALRSPAGRQTLTAVHSAYVRAGADIITADTFRCNLRALTRAGLNERAAGLMVQTAVTIAREASEHAVVAGSMAPVEDCYRPDLVPDPDELRREHAWLARRLVAAGVRLFLVETMNCIREARTALDAALRAGGRAWVSFVVGDRGRLLSGEPIAVAAHAVAADGAEAVLVNCTSPQRTTTALAALREAAIGPLGAYPNLEDRQGDAAHQPVDRSMPTSLGPAAFASLLSGWRADHALLAVGGCCGTRPSHIAALGRSLGSGRRHAPILLKP